MIVPNAQEDEEDICPVCDTDCTCGTNVVVDPVIKEPEKNVIERRGVVLKKKPKKKRQNKMVMPSVINTVQEEEDEDVVVDDMDDILDTILPLSEQETDITDEPFVDESEHIDSGDDEDIEISETQAIIDEFDSDTDGDSESSEEIIYLEEEYEKEEEEEEDGYGKEFSYWTTTDEEEEESVDFSFYDCEETVPIEENENTYDTIVSAFMHAMAPNDSGGTDTNGANTPVTGKSEILSAFDLASTLSLLSSCKTSQPANFIRRPSLPSNAVSAAQIHRESLDFSSENFHTSTHLITEDFPLSLDSNHTSYPSTSNTTYTSLHSQNQLNDLIRKTTENKKRASIIDETNKNGKKPRTDSIELSTEEVSMDDLLDTSQLHSDEEDFNQMNSYSKDLSRWQRIPISAFRLMRSKNKLWLER